MDNDEENVRLFLHSLKTLIGIYDEESGESVPIEKLKSLLDHYGLYN